jgi:hypothetical protein
MALLSNTSSPVRIHWMRAGMPAAPGPTRKKLRHRRPELKEEERFPADLVATITCAGRFCDETFDRRPVELRARR